MAKNGTKYAPSARKDGPGLPSSSPIGTSGYPSGGAAPRGGGRGPAASRSRGASGSAGRAHEAAGARGSHAMEVPGMPNGQGGNRNPNRVTGTGGRIPTSTPEPHDRFNEPEPTNPRMTPEVADGNGGARPNATPGRPPSHPALMTPDAMRPEGPLPNNPGGDVLSPTANRPGTRSPMF